MKVRCDCDCIYSKAKKCFKPDEMIKLIHQTKVTYCDIPFAYISMYPQCYDYKSKNCDIWEEEE